MPKKSEPAAPWANRVVEHRDIPPAELLANPKNWRAHPKAQEDALTAALDTVGWVRPVLARADTLTLLDGHLRVAAAIKAGQPTVPVDLVDVSDEEEAFILLTLDPLGGMAGVDESKIAELMQEVTVDDAALEAMIAALKPEPASEAEATGTRRTRIGAPKIQYEIVFDDEAQQQRWFALLRTLRPRYPSIETIAGRLDAFMAEALEALGLAPAKEGE